MGRTTETEKGQEAAVSTSRASGLGKPAHELPWFIRGRVARVEEVAADLDPQDRRRIVVYDFFATSRSRAAETVHGTAQAFGVEPAVVRGDIDAVLVTPRLAEGYARLRPARSHGRRAV